VLASVDPGNDRVHDARRAVLIRISILEQSLKLSYTICMTLKAIIHPAEEGGFWAEVPALPGCLTQGETLEELEANLHEAVELGLSVDNEVMELTPMTRFWN
jgi:predicted RNase H-like HicB family nuclease